MQQQAVYVFVCVCVYVCVWFRLTIPRYAALHVNGVPWPIHRG